MAQVNNKKVASFGPLEYAPFAGQTVLFDNPGRSTIREGDLSRLQCDLSDPSLNLYTKLKDALSEKVGIVRLMEEYRFCPLPSNTFHVTLSDGINEGNISFLSKEVRAKMEEAFKDMPRMMQDCQLATFNTEYFESRGPIGFRFSELTVFEGASPSLVATIEIADASYKSVFDTLAAWRSSVDRYWCRLGKPSSPEWIPHISLGYFADSYYVPHAKECLARWTDLMRKESEQALIEFRGASLYGFTDMVSFWRGPSVWVAKTGEPQEATSAHAS